MNHIPPKRADHLVYFNPGDLEFPIGLNVIGSVAPDDRHLVASGIVATFKGIWRVKDPFIRAFWTEEYENYDERFNPDYAIEAVE